MALGMTEMPGVVRVATAICAALAALGLSAAGSQTPAGAAVPRAIASNGAVIDMPDIAGLDCPGMDLRMIDHLDNIAQIAMMLIS